MPPKAVSRQCITCKETKSHEHYGTEGTDAYWTCDACMQPNSPWKSLPIHSEPGTTTQRCNDQSPSKNERSDSTDSMPQDFRLNQSFNSALVYSPTEPPEGILKNASFHTLASALSSPTRGILKKRKSTTRKSTGGMRNVSFCNMSVMLNNSNDNEDANGSFSDNSSFMIDQQTQEKAYETYLEEHEDGLDSSGSIEEISRSGFEPIENKSEIIKDKSEIIKENRSDTIQNGHVSIDNSSFCDNSSFMIDYRTQEEEYQEYLDQLEEDGCI
mmetsp:Transcript_150672/g.263326  ORF Transcript_150672/g.263326 Transcript_150672/m.263326 type:complete len:271 (-) Transcript_150672:334-1146(-)